MAITFRTNPAEINIRRNLNETQARFNSALSRLSSGLRIQTAADDAAGLAISAKFEAAIRSFAQAERNTNDAISLTQTASGALDEVQSLLSRMRELAVQAQNGTLGSSERAAIQSEATELRQEIDRIANVTTFNGQKLLDGSADFSFQVGIEANANNQIELELDSVRSSAIGASDTVNEISLATASGAGDAIDIIDAAIADVSTIQSQVGGVQNRLSVTLSNLATARENLSAANSRIRDADIAVEAALLTRNQILLQAGISVLAQANGTPALALTLLGA